MRKLFLLVMCLSVLALGSTALAGSGKSAQEYQKIYGGSIQVYQKILSETSCRKLQEHFDTAYSNHKMESNRHNTKGMRWCTGYMTCADQRMRDIGCY